MKCNSCYFEFESSNSGSCPNCGVVLASRQIRTAVSKTSVDAPRRVGLCQYHDGSRYCPAIGDMSPDVIGNNKRWYCSPHFSALGSMDYVKCRQILDDYEEHPPQKPKRLTHFEIIEQNNQDTKRLMGLASALSGIAMFAVAMILFTVLR